MAQFSVVPRVYPMLSLPSLLSLPRRLLAMPFLRFLVVGGLNTLFGYLCYAAAIGLLHLPLSLGLLCSQIAGVAFNYQSYGRLVFHRPGGEKKAFVFLRFIGAYALTYGANLYLLKELTALGLSPYVAQILALVVIVPTSYLLLRFLVWNAPRPQNRFPR